jgi:hypothetical protein
VNVLRPLALASLVLASPAFAAGPPIVPATQPANQNVPAIPEPAALALFVLGAGVVGVAIRRRKS